MKRPVTFLSLLLFSFFLCAPVVAEGGFKQDVKETAHEAGQGAKKLGRGIKRGAKRAGKAVGHAAVEAGHAIKRGAKKVKRAVKGES